MDAWARCGEGDRLSGSGRQHHQCRLDDPSRPHWPLRWHRAVVNAVSRRVETFSDSGVKFSNVVLVTNQDFARYQMQVGENIGAGDEPHFEDEARWREAAEKGRAGEFIERLPGGYNTQLGKWFADGRELSGGQWQKVALSRAFMRTRADVLVLDEPTAAMDAQAEAEVFEHFRQLGAGPHHDPDLAPLLHRAHGRPDRGAGARPARGAGQSRSVDAGGWPLRAAVHPAGPRLSLAGGGLGRRGLCPEGARGGAFGQAAQVSLELLELRRGETLQVRVVDARQMVRDARRGFPPQLRQRKLDDAPVGLAAGACQQALGFQPIQHAGHGARIGVEVPRKARRGGVATPRNDHQGRPLHGGESAQSHLRLGRALQGGQRLADEIADRLLGRPLIAAVEGRLGCGFAGHGTTDICIGSKCQGMSICLGL